MEPYSALKRHESRAHATTWMSPNAIMLHEISQMQRDKYCMSPPIEGT